MKIVCDSCATKYSISDDKVRGKVFKIRCKKCSHIIVVRGTSDPAAGMVTPSPIAAPEGGWHLVVDGDQVGPLPEADIRERLVRGEINAETYIWKDGFADWLKLSAVPEFAVDLASSVAAGSASRGGGGDIFGESQPTVAGETGAVRHSASSGRSGGLFAGVDAAAAGHSAADSGEDDAFSPGISSVPRGGGGDLFSAHAARPASDDGWPSGGGASANHDGGRVESLTAQRHENSVLFSLANLQSLAMPSAGGGGGGGARQAAASASSSGSEGSGLIDIRAMAATTLGSPSDSRGFGDDLPAFGAFSPAAPMLLEMPSSGGPSKWIYPAIGVAIVLVGAISFMAYNILTKPAVVAEAPAPPAADPAAPPVARKPSAAAEGATPAKPAIADENLPPREAAKPAETKPVKPDKPSKRGAKGGGSKDRKVASASADGEKKGGGGSAPAGAASTAPVVEPADKKPTKGSLDDLLETALAGKPKTGKPRVSDDDGSSKKAAPEPASSAGPLSKSAVVGGMNGVKPKVSDCFNQFKVPGMAMVSVVIAKSGKVSSASVTGKFAGTPTGSCVERAVKSASFPPSDGLSTPYPFTLK